MRLDAETFATFVGRAARASWLAALLASCGESTPASKDVFDAGAESTLGAADADLATCATSAAIGKSRPDCPDDLPSDENCATSSPSYEDVAPIFASRCAVCHRAGGLDTKFQFETYGGIHDDPKTPGQILTQVYGCKMPPSCAPDLEAAERKSMLQWLVCGAPEHRDAGTD